MVGVGILAIAVVAITAGTMSALHRFGGDPVQTALQRAVQREMRIATDVAKYNDNTIVANTIATTVPMPSASPIPVQMSIRTAAGPASATIVTITATDTNDQSKTATLNATLPGAAPAPGSTVMPNVTVAAPTGAP